MTGGRILALQEFDGFRPIITVRGIKDIHAEGRTPLSTVYYGDQLMFQDDTSIGLWQKFLSTWVNVETGWYQAKNNIDETLDQYIQNAPRLPIVPVQLAQMKLIAYGYDPMLRYFLQFAGCAPLFRQSEWWVEDETGDEYNPAWR